MSRLREDRYSSIRVVPQTSGRGIWKRGKHENTHHIQVPVQLRRNKRRCCLDGRLSINPDRRNSSISLTSPHRIDAHDTKQPLSLSTLRRHPLLPVRNLFHVRLFIVRREWDPAVVTTFVNFGLVIRRSLPSEGWSDSSLSTAGRGVAFEDTMTVVRRDKTPEFQVSFDVRLGSSSLWADVLGVRL